LAWQYGYIHSTNYKLIYNCWQQNLAQGRSAIEDDHVSESPEMAFGHMVLPVSDSLVNNNKGYIFWDILQWLDGTKWYQAAPNGAAIFFRRNNYIHFTEFKIIINIWVPVLPFSVLDPPIWYRLVPLPWCRLFYHR